MIYQIFLFLTMDCGGNERKRNGGMVETREAQWKVGQLSLLPPGFSSIYIHGACAQFPPSGIICSSLTAICSSIYSI